MHGQAASVKKENNVKPKKLLDRTQEVLRIRHCRIRTEEAYPGWMKRYILFHGKRHPEDMGAAEVEAFLSHLAVQGNVAPSTQNQALNALLFLYKHVLEKDLGNAKIDAVRARRKAKLPVVLTKAEVRKIILSMPGQQQLMAKLLYGSGLRLMECIRLRVKDLDFGMNDLTVRDGKGGRKRPHYAVSGVDSAG